MLILLELATRSTLAEAQSGTWQSLTFGQTIGSFGLLLTDGSVLEPLEAYVFIPDITGSYVNGTLAPAPPLPTGYNPGAFASAVLPDGRVIVEGGECSPWSIPCSKNTNYTNLGAIFDPDASSWTTVAPPTGWATIGGAPSVVLPNGTFMMGQADPSGTTAQALLDAATMKWTPTGTGKADQNFEEGWVLLPNGRVLVVQTHNLNGSPNPAQQYDPETGPWTSAGISPVSLTDPGSNEIGPGVLRPDGTVIVFGALTNGPDHTAIYNSATGEWSAGPDLPAIGGQYYSTDDAPAAVLPNGNVLFAASPSKFEAPVHFFEFDGSTITQVAKHIAKGAVRLLTHHVFWQF